MAVLPADSTASPSSNNSYDKSQIPELTFKIATGNDWWFHAKGIPGSHVIVKSEGKELPDRTFEEAAPT